MRIFRHKNLVVIVVVIIFGLIFQQTGKSSGSAPHLTRLALMLQIESQPGFQQERQLEPTRAPRVTKAPPPLLMPWRGPIEPHSALPNAAQVIYKVPTSDPVVFLTIDDGLTQAPDISAWLIAHHLPISLFLDNDAIKNNYPYFARLQQAGMAIQDHTMTHPQLPKHNLDQQKAEICGAADTYAKVFGQRPTLFRPPYGAFNDVTRQAAAECGMRAIVMWHATVEKGAMHFQDNIGHLQSGDIVLMHFRPELLQDIQILTRQVQQDNLRIGRLEDWLR